MHCTTASNYAYGPFGEVIRATGPMAKINPFRFSTKYDDDETDLLYYGYRYYNPSTGRWLSRDPIGEKGGLNLYGYTRNDSIDRVDLLGQEESETLNDPAYLQMLAQVGKPCCDKPAWLPPLVLISPTASYFAAPPSEGFDASATGVLAPYTGSVPPIYWSWWSCYNWLGNNPATGPLPGAGPTFQCHAPKGPGEYVCAGLVRATYLSCDHGKLALHDSTVSGNFNFSYKSDPGKPGINGAWFHFGGTTTQVYP